MPCSRPYVYVLRCSDDTLYTGWTTDLARRLKTHQAGKGAHYTKTRLPLELLAFWRTPTRKKAMSLEARFKRLSRSEKLNILSGTQVLGTRLYKPPINTTR